MTNQFMLGFDYWLYHTEGIQIPLYAPVGHLICVGGSNSGKSTALLYWLYKMRKAGIPIELAIMDFKSSKEFEGISEHYYEFEEIYEGIKEFYTTFINLPEGGDGKYRILIVDEIAGLLMHFGLSKEGKNKVNEIQMMTSSILMLGRSKKVFLWYVLQRYTASLFPSGSGAADNFHICAGLGRLSVDGRRLLFAGETFDGEEDLLFGQGKGIVLIDGQQLKGLIIPQVSKRKIKELLQV